MAAKLSSLSSAGGAMRASLVLVLLLAAVASAHGRSVECENKMDRPVKMNGKDVPAYGKGVIDVDVYVTLIVKGADGHDYSKTFPLPKDVIGIVVVYIDLFVTVKVTAVSGLLGLLKTLLGLVVVTLKVIIH